MLKMKKKYIYQMSLRYTKNLGPSNAFYQIYEDDLPIYTN